MNTKGRVINRVGMQYGRGNACPKLYFIFLLVPHTITDLSLELSHANPIGSLKNLYIWA
jgi:hypothetical protein